MFKEAVYIAVDIETIKPPVDPTVLDYYGDKANGLHALMPPTKASKKLVPCAPQIDMIGYCGLFKREDGTLYSQSIVLNITCMDDIYWMRKFNNLPAPKICQNGGYEATHLIRYNAPLYNWLCDTFHFMHSWYAELPRTLDFISSLFITDYQYWKDEIESNRAEYNAKDTHMTLWSWVFMVNMAPQWAHQNYLIEFRKCFPAITSGLEGFLVDLEERAALDAKYNKQLEEAQKRLDHICWEGFNANSSPQVKELMNAMSIAKFKNSDDKALQRFAEIGPLEALIVELILEVRQCQKKLSTYIRATLLDGRLLYELNHGGTDTGRAASKSSNLWCGTQIQNQDNKLRTMYIADDGWLIANCDGSQAESRTTAYISEDAQLMDSVENAPDFHKRNASLFFGIPEEEISDKIRKLSKRVNHGSNYNMGAGVLLETMGSKNVLEAKRLLDLPQRYGLVDTCKYLLGTFEATYPDVKGKYYDEVCEEIRITGMLKGATGWTRYCFDLPSRHGPKPILNKYVAHPPQSLSVMLVDEAEFDFWYEYQIKKNIVRLKAQVHDEIVYMVKEEHYPITKKALSELMARPVEVRGRTLVIPNDGGGIGYRWGDIKD
jgi:DNA polymerase I-like protein with 3'-5' exonuclease and polymerase domains